MNTKIILPVLHNRLYQHFIDPNILWALFLTLALALPAVSIAQDTDNDGVDDTHDNCTEIANLNQRDTDNDGFGNICDADLDNNGLVSFNDLNLFRSAFDTDNADADLDGSGRVSFNDLNIFRSLFDKPPGPKGSASGGNISQADAARFLTQTTFGPTLQNIDELVALGNYEDWLNEQFAKPATLQLPKMQSLNTRMCEDNSDPDSYQLSGSPSARHNAWWETVIKGEDQLRQRVAFALSQILVVSDAHNFWGYQFGVADYHDILVRHAFGNYRDLLQEVTLHPIMGIYLSMIKNEKADPINNIRPDENFARELMQLFTLGVYQLQPNGELILNNGKPIPAYTQQDIKEFARVFTGWTYSDTTYWWENGSILDSMVSWQEYHDTGEKHLLNSWVLPENQTPFEDISGALDNVFNHPNTGPFISKLLIQRLVTSNPSPDYVLRVANRFNNNGQGIRGDLKAVVKAILLDPEARTLHPENQSAGKLREPLLRISHVFRAFDAQPSQRVGKLWPEGETCGQGSYDFYEIWRPMPDYSQTFGQQVLGAPSVFNFYLPSYSPQGPARDANLVAPEFQIATDNLIVNTANFLNQLLLWIGLEEWTLDGTITTINTDREAAMADNPEQLLDHLNVLLLNGQMSGELRQILSSHLNNGSFPEDERKNGTRAREIILLILNSPDYLIQE